MSFFDFQTELPEDLRTRFFIDGAWVPPKGDKRTPLVSPTTEKVMVEMPEATVAEVDAAVKAARRAFDNGPWPRTSPQARADVLQRIADDLRRRESLLRRVWTAQVGAPIAFSSFMTPLAIDIFDHAAEMAREFAFEEERRTGPGGRVKLVQHPVGVVGLITPWNAPLILLSYKVAAALATGCTVVAKPSPETPFDAQLLAQAAQEAGLPPGVLNIVHGGREVGAALVAHPGIDKVSFTGSTVAGKAIAATCSERLARVDLELGGKSAAVLLDDADIGSVLPGLLPFTMPFSGQICFSLTRVLVPESRHDEMLDSFVEAVRHLKVGDPTDPATHVGPLTMQRQLERVLGYIEAGKAQGARVAIGGGRPAGIERGFFVEPTVFHGVTNDMTIAQEEIFGPVVSFIPYRDEADAVRLANDSRYGLNNAVFSADFDRAARVASQLRSGSVSVNGCSIDTRVPFGGFKESGVGRQGGPEGLKAYLETQTQYLHG